jgi:chemotaxis protein methyltransferase CheR
MNPGDFQFLADLLRKRSGLVLTEDKAYLIENRLMPIARKVALEGLTELVQVLRAGKDEGILRDVVEAMTTNETFFFRDSRQFDNLRDEILPRLIEARKATRRLRFWSAACSAGQEPYTLLMILGELGAKLQGWRIEVIASDLSREILEKAKAGIYTQFEVQRGLPITLLVKYFTQLQANQWQISEALRKQIQFREVNLLGQFGTLGTFDLILCRNVLIYFDQATKGETLAKMAAQTNPGGYLFLGGAETVLGVSDKYQPVRGLNGFYELAGAASAAKPVGAAPGATPPAKPAASTATA